MSTLNLLKSKVPVASPNNKKQLTYTFNTCNEVRGIEPCVENNKQKTMLHKM